MKVLVAVVVILKLEHAIHLDAMHRHIFTATRPQLSVVMLSLAGWSVVQSKVVLLEWQEELLVEQLSASVSPVVEMVTEEEPGLVLIIVQEVTSVGPVTDK